MNGISRSSCLYNALLSPKAFISLCGLSCTLSAQDVFQKDVHSFSYTTIYSGQVSAISPLESTLSHSRKKSHNMPDLSVTQKTLINQNNTSSLLYKVITKPKKLVNQAAAGIAIYGLDYIGMAKPLKKSMDYIKQKTRFEFGECGKLQFSGKLKAKTCLFDNSSIELNSDYKMNNVTIDFNWSL